MSERPNIVLGGLLGVAASFAALIAIGLVGLGESGVAGLAATVVGAFSACVFFLAELRRVPLSSLLLVALTLASLVAFGRALLAYFRQQRLLRALPLRAVREHRLLDLVRAAGSVSDAIYIAPASRPSAFCFGLLHPRVVVTEGLLARLDHQEQAAAVWHEAHHARVREPLKCLLARLASSTFFWLPALADLLDRYLLLKELDADRLAASRTSRRALAGALCEVVGSPTPGAAVGLSEFAAARFDRLFDPKSKLPPLSRAPRVALTATMGALVAFIAVFPARLPLAESQHLHSMLTSTSLHGLPGMAAGFTLNAVLAVSLALLIRRRKHGVKEPSL